MTEQQEGELTEPTQDQALSIPQTRLAGSPACLNCGTGLRGPFCYYCGQPDRNFLRFFPSLLREFFEDFLDMDSRFVRTLKPLMFKPGRLTRDYLDGRRFRYTPPMRLYIFSSIAFFVIAALISTNAARESVESFNSNSTGQQLSEEQAQRAREALEDMPPELRDQLNLDLDQLIEDAASGPDEAATAEQKRAEGPSNQWFQVEGIQVNDEPWDPVTNPVELPWVPQWIDDWINRELEDSPAKAEEINRNPDVIIEQVFDLLPATMFVLLPVVALLFKFWYLFARRYYIEHLIFALHNHAFLFVALLLILLSAVGRIWAQARGLGWLDEGLHWFLVAVAIWIPLYLFISLRTVYRQNWFLTFLKFGVIGISYVTLLVLITVIVSVLGFLLL
ncbi:MAG: DUF3667 domain-containing protein [Xanthomonadales bacterium]|nr:DUF3667 domain-containing protein [Xanthomonadales bacterium]